MSQKTTSALSRWLADFKKRRRRDDVSVSPSVKSTGPFSPRTFFEDFTGELRRRYWPRYPDPRWQACLEVAAALDDWREVLTRHQCPLEAPHLRAADRPNGSFRHISRRGQGWRHA